MIKKIPFDMILLSERLLVSKRHTTHTTLPYKRTHSPHPYITASCCCCIGHITKTQGYCSLDICDGTHNMAQCGWHYSLVDAINLPVTLFIASLTKRM